MDSNEHTRMAVRCKGFRKMASAGTLLFLGIMAGVVKMSIGTDVQYSFGGGVNQYRKESGDYYLTDCDSQWRNCDSK